MKKKNESKLIEWGRSDWSQIFSRFLNVKMFSGIYEHRESTAIGAAIIAYEIISKMATSEIMDVVNTVVGLFAAAVFSLYKGKKS